MASGIEILFHVKRDVKIIFKIGVQWADYEKPSIIVYGYSEYLKQEGLENIMNLQGITIVPCLFFPEREGKPIVFHVAEEIFLFCQSYNGRAKKDDAQSLRVLYSLITR